MIDATDTCPALECCDPNPFAYETPEPVSPSLSFQSDATCSNCFGSAYSNYIVANGLGVALTWSIVSGTLPTGLTFHGGYNETGKVLIDGTPTQSGNFTITVQAVTPQGGITTGTFSINVIRITTASLPDWTTGTPYSAQLTAVGGSGNYGWQLNSGTLPDGLVLDVSGLIHGTPTGAAGTNPLVFEVVDINCESVFLTPQVLLVNSSVTTILTWYGYNEFIPSTPPKKYRTITFNGTSKRTAFTCEFNPSQCAGAKYVYSGVGQVDILGNQTSNYTKLFYAECPAQFWPQEPVQSNDRAINTSQDFIPQFVGFCWSAMPGSCATCDPVEGHWPLIGNKATNNPTVDLSGFMHNVSDVTTTPTSLSVVGTFHGLTSIEIGTKFTATLFGTDLSNYNVTVGANTYIARAAVTDPPNLEFPNVFIQDNSGVFVLGGYINFTDENNYSAVLSDEYTDADAQAHAQVINGNSRTTENLPRTNGFVSRFTTVNYDLQCSNLIPGQNYTATVDFIDSNGIKTTLTEGFQATGPTHTINHNVLDTPVGGTKTVYNPRITVG